MNTSCAWKKSGITKRVISFALALIMALGIIPLSAVEALAATVPPMSSGELNPADNGGKIVNGYYTMSAGQFTNGNKITSHWAKDYYSEFMSNGTIYGVKTSDGLYMPMDENITGRDAMAIAMMFFYGKNSGGYRVYQGASGSGWSARQNTYTNAPTHFYQATGSGNSLYQDVFKGIASKSSFSRKEAFLLVAFCIQQESGGKVKLSDYSDEYFMMMGDKKTYSKVWNPNTGRYVDYPNRPVTDAGSITFRNFAGYYIQAVSMLIDLGIMQGKQDNSATLFEIDMNGTITYAEFLVLLEQLDNNGSNWNPTEYSQINPKLNVYANDATISYRDFLNGYQVSIPVTLDATGTTSRQTITKYAFTVEDAYGTEDSYTSTSKSKTFNYYYRASDVGFSNYVAQLNHGEKTYSIRYDGEVVVTDRLNTTAKATGYDIGTLRIVNGTPTASFTVMSDNLTGGSYGSTFYYVGQPITLQDASSDPEGALEEWYYNIKYNGAVIASSETFDDEYVTTTGKKYIEDFTPNASEKNHSVTFSAKGTYTIEAYVYDEMGKMSNVATRTINVTGEPEPPTAIIEGNDYTYSNYNTTLTDASTDPNDDIVSWEWGEVWWFDEVMDENGDGTGEGEWVNVTGKTGSKDDPEAWYNGTFKNQTRQPNGTYSTATATVQFTRYGAYRIYETVTDATGLSDTTYHEIKVLEDIPVIVVDPDPVPPQEETTYTVTFVNTNGSTTYVEVEAGSFVTADQVPNIVDVDGLYEHGWTQDGTKLVEPTEVKITGNITFVVYTTPEDTNSTIHTVTFINTDGTTTTVKVPHNGKLVASDVPEIINLPSLVEKGWTLDDIDTVNPTTVTISRDMVFWVKTDPVEDDSHTIIFVNTDGSTTVIVVPDGQPIPADKIPGIMDVPGLIENGWTSDGGNTIIADPSTVYPEEDMVFRVDTTPDDGNTHKITFINTDGSKTVISVPDGETIPLDKIPGIVDIPKLTENGWTPDGGKNVYSPAEVSGMPVTGDMVFRVDTDAQDDTHNVIFVNTDGEIIVVEVPDGETIPPELVPDITDLPDITENGWVIKGTDDIVNPSEIPVDKDIVFVVDTDEEDDETHTVIFVNTDGSVTVVEIPDGGTIDLDKIPGIIDVPDLIENGWTNDGENIFTSEDVANTPITKDEIFYVDTDVIPDDSHTVTFINTDGTITTIVVTAGQPIPGDKVPGIVDVDGVIENGWTMDGSNVVNPAGTIVDGDLVFWVKTEVDSDDDDMVTITFVNTDGTVTTIEIPKGTTIGKDDVPGIVDLEDVIENGWTNDGKNIVDPTETPIDEDTVFWVDTTVDKPEEPDDGLPYYDGTGRLVIKQNRAAVIDATASLSPPNDPIQVERTEWVVEGVDGYDISNVKFAGGKASGLKATFIAKEPGEFTITVTLHNNYSDRLEQDKPNSTKLEARTKTITIIVYPDRAPEASLFVNNANPNFHTNPEKTDITVASSATSPDGDIISKYEWSIVRDMNNDNVYDEEPFYTQTGSDIGVVTFPVEFQSGVVGTFLAKLKVTESSGQKTLPEYIDEDDNLTTETEKSFEVNWTPCIEYDFTFNGNAWAYVDDIIPIAARIKDENTATCEVDWTLKKKVGDSYIAVDTSQWEVWDFGTLGGELRVEDDGYYVLEAEITDDHGYSETFVSNEIRIYDLPTAVISDDPEYRWKEVQWEYKQSRRFDLDGTASYPDDETGPALHQINHALDTWSITPIGDGAQADAIYVLADDGVSRLESEETTYFYATKDEFDEQIAIIEPGTYRVGYQVTNTYGKKSDFVYQMITIIEDREPTISTGTPSNHEYLGSAEDDAMVLIGLTNVHITSDDMDIVGGVDNYTGQYRYDSDNDGDFEDEEWQDCEIKATPNLGLTDIALSMTTTTNQVGWYQFRLQVFETFGQPTLDTIIPDECYLDFEFFHEVEVDNIRPHGTFDLGNTVYGDIIFAMGKSKNVGEVSEKTMNFENKFGEVEGADLFRLDVQTVTTAKGNLADGIAWNKTQMSGSIGSVTTSPDGLTVEMKGNQTNAGQNITYTMDYEGKIGFDFNYNLVFGDSFNGAGVVMNLAEIGNQLKATVIWISNGSKGLGASGIYDITYTKGSNYSSVPSSVKQLQTFSLAMSGRLEIEANAGTISVTGSGVNNQIYTVTTDYNGDGFGFYSSHYSHNCSQIGSFKMTNIELEITKQVTLAEAMTDVSFNTTHDVFVIWTEDTISQELDKSSPTYEEDYANLLSLLISQNIHLVILGSQENKDEMEALLDQCLVPGIFIDESTVDKDLDAARDFIAAVLREGADSDVKYVLVDEETVYDKYYTDFNGHDHWYSGGLLTDEDGNVLTDEDGNPLGVDTILSSKWWYSHEPDYFLNSMGLYDLNETWQADEITTFLQTGRYYVDYKVTDNSVPDAYLDDNSTSNPFHEYRYWSNNYGNDEYDESGNMSNPYAEIYVHRRPLSDFTFTAYLSETDELTGIDIFENGYDLDHYEEGNPLSDPDKGLQQYEWSWQLAEDPSSKTSATFTDAEEAEKWINDQMASIDYNSATNVIVSYRVRDIDGVEHEEEVVYTHQIGAINREAIYMAPAPYHHTTLDEDLVVNGKVVAKAGTYVTTDYDEAVSELRAKLADCEKKLTNATNDYNQKDAAATTSENNATAAEKAADKAEADRDNKQDAVNAQQVVVDGKNDVYENRVTEVNTAADILAQAKTERDDALSVYNQVKSDYDSANAAYTAALSKLQAQQAVTAEIVAQINELNAAHEAEEIPDEEYEAQLAALNQERSDSLALEVSIKTNEVDPAKSVTDDAKVIMDAKKAIYDAAVAKVTSKQSDYDAKVQLRNTAKAEYDAQNAILTQLKKELAQLETEATNARETATQMRAKATADRATSNAAKTAMDTAKKNRDAAQKALNDFQPLTTTQTVWVTSTETQEIPDGVWSHWVTYRISGDPLPPVAKFVTNKIYYDIKEPINITDQSYSPNGNNIVEWDWTITGGVNLIEKSISYSIDEKPGKTQVESVAEMNQLISEFVTDTINSQTLGLTDEENTYKITLVVTDDKSVPLTSTPYSVSIVIQPSNTPPTVEPNDSSIYKKDSLIVYEYDEYDADQVNEYYTYGDVPQYRGTETLDWTLKLDDPDNHDDYGTANDTNIYTVDYTLERFTHQNILTVLSNLTTSETLAYGPKDVTAAQALINSEIAPFITVKDEGLDWGAYRITTKVTDNPLNGSDKKTVSIITNPDKVPKHLYVVPKLEIADVHYLWEGVVDTTEQVPVGDTITVTLTTSGETTAVYAMMPNGDGGEDKTAGTLVRTEADGTKVWSITPVIPDTLEEEDLVDGKGYTFYVESHTTYGSEDGTTVMRTKREAKNMNVLAIKLYDFRLTNVTDPAVEFDTAYPVSVPYLAYDDTDSPAGELMKKGYSFYFELSSMGLKGDNDAVRITPTFYTKNAAGIYEEVDVYYKNEDGDYVLGTYDPDAPTNPEDTFVMYASGQSGSVLGTMRELMLDADDRTIETDTGSIQTWSGRYGIPSTAVFVKKGAALSTRNLVDGPILVTFELEAMKNGDSKYAYIGRGQWHLERCNEDGTYIDVTKAHYMDGSVIVFDGDRSAMDNYDSLPVWRRTN